MAGLTGTSHQRFPRDFVFRKATTALAWLNWSED
jgi:hypothetical protein